MKPCIIFQFCKMLALEDVLPAIKPSASSEAESETCPRSGYYLPILEVPHHAFPLPQ